MPFYRGTLKIKRQNTILCKTILNERRTKESHTKINGQIQAFRHYSERTNHLQLTGCLSKTEKSKFGPSLQ